MIHQVCPNPVVLQQLYTGPLGAHIDAFAQQLLVRVTRVQQQSMPCACSLPSAPGSSDKPSQQRTSTNSSPGLFTRPPSALSSPS